MGTTSDKLTYLNTTKGKIKDVINMTGANITSDTTFRNYATKLYDGYISVLKDKNTLLDNMPKSTSTGYINEGLGLPIYEGKMSKDSTQDGTPTPENPIEVKTVKGNVGITITNGTSTRNYTIPLGNNEICGIGNYKDELIVDKNGKCWLNKKIGKAVLNGSENWEVGATGFFLRPDTNEDFANRNKTVYLGFCNNFIFNKNSTTWTNKNYCGFSSTNIFWVSDDFEIATTIVDWNNWLSTHNTEVYYPLATENLIDLNYTVDLTLFEGVNNISNSDDMDMEIKYIKDTYE